MRKFILMLAVGVAASSAHAAEWDQFLQAGFGAAASKDGSVCYARVYDAGHLAANKAQRIQRFFNAQNEVAVLEVGREIRF